MDAVRRLLRGEIADPHALLGAHALGGGAVVRAFVPDARGVTLLEDDNGAPPRRSPMRRAAPEGLFEAELPDRTPPLRYRLEIERDGATQVREDPYRFPPTLGDLDLLLLGEGTHRELYHRMGAHRRVVDYAQQLERSLMIRTTLAKFVPRQVQRLIEAAPEAPSLEKRETDVTVLFADITGYTRLSARLPQETLDALVERYFGAFLDEIAKHGGEINETAGDGLMVIFNAPLPCPDPSQRAVRLARSLRAGFAQAVAPWQHPDAPVGLGIGIAHGPATVGQIGFEGRVEYAAIGSAANLAARLCAQAQSGQILVSDEVRAATADEVDTFAVGAIPLKGFAASVNAYEL